MLEEYTLTSPGAAGNNPPVVQHSSVETEVIQSGNSEVSGQIGDMQTSSPSTERSTNAYIERTLQELSSQQEVRFLSPKQSVEEVCRTEQEVSKTSEYEAITKVSINHKANNNAPMESDVQDELVSETSHFRTKADFFQTDTSELEDLYDSAGAVLGVKQPTFIAPGVCEPTSSEHGAAAGDQVDDVASVATRVRIPKDTQKLSASGRNLLRKYFSEAAPIRLSMGHSTFAFSEP